MESPEVAVEKLYEHLIGFERTERQNRAVQVRKLVREEYSSIDIVREALTEAPELESDGLTENRVDLAVVSSGKVYEINRAFSFASQPTPRVLHDVESWTYKIHSLRDAGGALMKDGTQIATLPADTPVVASIWPPETDAQKDLYAQATKKWGDLGILTVNRADTRAHALHLAERIA